MFQINFGNVAEYSRYEGGGSELLPKEGYFQAEISSITEGESSSGNKTLVMTLTIRDEDCAGMKIVRTVPVTGKRKDGKDNVHGLLSLLESSYSATAKSDAEIREKLAKLNGASQSSDAIMGALRGQPVFIDVAARSYVTNDGQTKWTSDVRNFVLKQKYDDTKGINAHRRPLPPRAQAAFDGTDTMTAAPQSNGRSNGTVTDIV